MSLLAVPGPHHPLSQPHTRPDAVPHRHAHPNRVRSAAAISGGAGGDGATFLVALLVRAAIRLVATDCGIRSDRSSCLCDRYAAAFLPARATPAGFPYRVQRAILATPLDPQETCRRCNKCRRRTKERVR